MGREIRKVPVGWEHPKNYMGGLEPLRGGPYAVNRDEFMALAVSDGLQAALDEYGAAPDISAYMPEIADGEPFLIAMYENTTEGTPISPPFATAEEVARWCADNGASMFGDSTAPYEDWLRIAHGAWASG